MILQYYDTTMEGSGRITKKATAWSP